MTPDKPGAMPDYEFNNLDMEVQAAFPNQDRDPLSVIIWVMKYLREHGNLKSRPQTEPGDVVHWMGLSYTGDFTKENDVTAPLKPTIPDDLDTKILAALDIFEMSMRHGLVFENGSPVHNKIIEVLTLAYERAAQPEPVVNGETPNTEHKSNSEQQTVHKPASDAALETIKKAIECGKTVRDTFGSNAGGGKDVFEEAFKALDCLAPQFLQARVVDVGVLGENLRNNCSCAEHFATESCFKCDVIRWVIDHLAATYPQGLVIKKGGE